LIADHVDVGPLAAGLDATVFAAKRTGPISGLNVVFRQRTDRNTTVLVGEDVDRQTKRVGDEVCSWSQAGWESNYGDGEV